MGVMVVCAVLAAGCMSDDEEARPTTTAPVADEVDEASTRPVYDFAHKTPSEVDDYWTEERLEATPEHKLPILPGDADPALPPEPEGPPTRVDPKPPGGGQATLPRARPSPRRLLEEYVYKRYRWRGPSTAPPAKMWGRLLDSSGSCSATIVGSANRSLVWTAGHCLWDNDTHRWFDRNPVFIPGYRKGKAPYGKWTARKIGVHPRWKKARKGKPAWGFDVGYVLVERLGGEYLTDRIDGYQGIAFNYARNYQYLAGGYPSVGKFKGRFLHVCDAPFAAVDKSAKPATTAIGCDMSEGSSGGGWLIAMGHEQAGVGWVFGVNSYGYDGEDAMYSPYFGTGICRYYRRVSGMSLTCG
jgi:hypothetical protein